MTSSSIPDGFSTEQLEELMKKAKNNTTVTPGDPKINHILERICDTSNNLVEELGDMEVYKFIADYCIFQLTQMHKSGFDKSLDNNDRVSATEWSHDLSRLQIINEQLRDVYMGPSDFMHDDYEGGCTCGDDD
jgi:hypothetical protein